MTWVFGKLAGEGGTLIVLRRTFVAFAHFPWLTEAGLRFLAGSHPCSEGTMVLNTLLPSLTWTLRQHRLTQRLRGKGNGMTLR